MVTARWYCPCGAEGDYPDPMPKTDAALPDAKHMDTPGNHATTTTLTEGIGRRVQGVRGT